MDWFRPIGTAGLAWRSVAMVGDRFSLWVPALIVAAVQLPLLLALLFFHQPVLVPVAGPLVRLLGGEAATHYPGHILALPAMFERSRLVVDIALAWIALGVTTVRFAAAFGAPVEEDAWRGARRRAASVTGIVALGHGARLSLAALFATLPAAPVAGGWGGLAGDVIAAVLVQAALAYAVPYALLHGRPIGGAIGASFRLARANAITTFILVAIPAAVLAAPAMAVRVLMPYAAAHPRWIAAALALRVVLGWLVTVVLAGSVTRLFLSKTRHDR